ncbi:MAG TPA: exopolysaccharide biosynthesis polyprenyl glycosylphosphotransferase [Pirellulales bacterium]|nr:exopolysaccharide biosynthesis polyprenyl glycosylphosphotransferase [Pirellulales bacterium]
MAITSGVQGTVRQAGPHFRLPAKTGAARTVDDVIALDPCPVLALGIGALAKRAVDFTGSLVLLSLLGIPMLVVALVVRLTSAGPAIYTQERVGLGGRRFLLFKFRTMRADAEAGTGPVWAQEHDPRRTGFGAFLRRWSVDELPQLVNVLKGEMSLVGPRPERPYFVAQFSQELPDYMQRHGVLPGLTGWAQLNGLRGNTSISARLDFDLYYIRHWSVWFDLCILFTTPIRMLAEKNAY